MSLATNTREITGGETRAPQRHRHTPRCWWGQQCVQDVAATGLVIWSRPGDRSREQPGQCGPATYKCTVHVIWKQRDHPPKGYHSVISITTRSIRNHSHDVDTDDMPNILTSKLHVANTMEPSDRYWLSWLASKLHMIDMVESYDQHIDS